MTHSAISPSHNRPAGFQAVGYGSPSLRTSSTEEGSRGLRDGEARPRLMDRWPLASSDIKQRVKCMICHALSTQKKHTSEPKKRVLGLVHSNHQGPFCKALTVQEAWCTNGRNVDSNWVIISNSQLPHSTISVSLSFAVMFHSQGTCHVEVAMRSFPWACPGGVSTFHASLEGLRVPRWPPIGVKIHYMGPRVYCTLYNCLHTYTRRLPQRVCAAAVHPVILLPPPPHAVS